MSTRADAAGAFWGDVDDEVALNRYRTLVNAIDDGVYQLDADGRFVAVNDVIVAATGYDREDLLDEHVSLLLDDEDVERIEREIASLRESRDDITPFELAVHTADGGTIPCELRINPLVEEGEFRGTIGVARDVSETKERLESLESARASYESITDVLDEAEIGVFVLDDEFEIVWLDETIERYLGLDRNELIGRDKRRVVDETIKGRFEDPERFAENVLATYDDNGYAGRFECRVTPGEDREERWLERHSKPIESGKYAGGWIELYYEITDRKRSEGALRETEKRFQSLVDAVEEYAIFRLDPDGRVISWNEGAREIKGYDSAEILGEHFSTFYTEEDRAAGVPERNLERATEEGSVEDEGWRVRKDGSRFWANATITAVRDDDGTHRGYLKVTRDTTDRYERERELESELRRVFGRISDAFYAVDEEFRFTHANERAEELLEHTEEELLGENLWEVFPTAAEIDEVWDAFQTALNEQEATGYELYYDTLDRWIEANLYPSETGISVYFRDVTERKEREQELERYETIVETVDDGIYALDPDARFITVNEAYCEMLGYDREELLGRHAATIHSDEIAHQVQKLAREVTEGEREGAKIEVELETSSGEVVPTETRFAPFSVGEEYGRCGVVRDISERVERERALEESERRYRTLVENFPNGAVGLYDEDFTYTVAGGQMLDELGIDPEEVIGRSIYERYPDELVERILPHFRAVFDGESRTFEVEYHDHHLLAYTVPVRDADGEIHAGMLMIQDITERKEREQYLREAKAQLEAATEAGAVGTWEWHVPEDRFVAGASFAKTFGADPEEAREGVPLEQLLSSIHEGDRDRVVAEIEETVETCGEYEAEFRVRNADGELRWVVARGHVECDENGDAETFPGALTDITERKRAELEAEKQRKQLETLFDVLPVGAVVADADGSLLRANGAAKEIWGGDVFDAESGEEYEKYSAVWADTGEPVEPEDWTMYQVLQGEAVTDPNVYEISAFDGKRRIIMEHGMPVRDEHGDVSRAVVTLTDITERREYRRKLEESNERLEQFAYSASHDLQEPLRMVTSYLQLLDRNYGDALDEDGEEFLEFAVDGAERMRELIDALLEYSRVETRGDPFEPVDLNEVLENVRSDLQIRIDESNARIATESLPTVEGDASQIRQVFQNLLSNAITYAGDEPPRIEVSAERREGRSTAEWSVPVGENGDDEWIVSIRDEGIGIDPDDQQRIFEVFQRLHTREEHPGTGIGLALCRRIVERHGGEIWVDAEPGEGSIFSFTLPAAGERDE